MSIKYDPLLSISKAAEWLGMSESTLRRLIRAQKVPVVRLNRMIRLSSADLERMIQEARRPALADRGLPGALDDRDMMALLDQVAGIDRRASGKGGPSRRGARAAAR